MLYIPALKLCYLAGPKTGSVSAMQYLIAFAETNALETTTYTDYNLPEHGSYAEVHAAVSQEPHGSSVRYCTHIRHPVERVLSFFHFARLDRSLVPWWQANHRPDDLIDFADWFTHPGTEAADELAYVRWLASFAHQNFCRDENDAYPVKALRLEDGMRALRDILVRRADKFALRPTLPPPPDNPLNAGDAMATEKGIALPPRQHVALTAAQEQQIKADWQMDMLLGGYR